jgi:hypothetical protein
MCEYTRWQQTITRAGCVCLDVGYVDVNMCGFISVRIHTWICVMVLQREVQQYFETLIETMSPMAIPLPQGA